MKVKYKGAWLIVDNGYLNWATTVPPMKKSCIRSEIRFSAWLESMRKDVECTFGILKGRFRILKMGIWLHKQKAADMIFLTCCALHNMLLDVDGMDPQWEEEANDDDNKKSIIKKIRSMSQMLFFGFLHRLPQEDMIM
jgi:hypothetical protein